MMAPDREISEFWCELARGQLAVRGEDQADGDRAGLERVLRLGATRVQRGELPRLEVVGGDEAGLALRPLRALRRPAERGRRARALAGQVTERGQTVFLRE